MGVDRDVAEAIIGLLRTNPADRWTLDDVENWAAAETKFPEHKRGLPLSFGRLDPSMVLQKYPYRNNVPPAFAARLPPSFLSGQSIGQLQFSNRGFLVLLVVRNSHWRRYYTSTGELAYENVIDGTSAWPNQVRYRPEVVNVPKASTRLEAGDIIVCGVKDADCDVVEDQIDFMCKELAILPDSPRDSCDSCSGSESCGSSAAALEAARCREHTGVTQDLPEFDFTAPLPEWCAEAILGPADMKAPGQNALDLRNTFGMSLAGLLHEDNTVTWWPGATQTVRKGDRGLIMRVPRWSSDEPCASEPTVNPEALLELMQETRFRKRLGLQDSAKWDEWMQVAQAR
jgi:hypothetical protein